VNRLGLRIALVLGGVALGLAVGEALVRAFGPEIQIVFRDQIVASDDPAQIYSLRPGAADGREMISAAGLRDRDFATPKPPGRVRIAAAGDSITFGFGNPRAAAWPKRLEEALAARAREGAEPVEVINLGVPGYNVEQVAARLAAVGLAFEPDAIVYGYALNDPQGVSVEASALATLHRAFDGGAPAWLGHSKLFLLARKIAFERRKQDALRAERPSDPAFVAAESGDRVRYFRALHGEGESAARLQRGLDALAAIARERALPVLVVLFPLFGEEDGAGPEALADVHALVAAEAERRGFAVLDLQGVYARGTRALGDDLSLDFMHPNPLGQRLAAAAVLDWICASDWPPARAIDCAREVAGDAADVAVRSVLRRAQAAPPR
jgi:lysophospholipase L1-like esterase